MVFPSGFSLKPVEESKPLVIPLIEKNKWRVPKPEDLEKPNSQPPSDKNSKPEIKVSSTGDEVTDKAVEELLLGRLFTFMIVLDLGTLVFIAKLNIT